MPAPAEISPTRQSAAKIQSSFFTRRMVPPRVDPAREERYIAREAPSLRRTSEFCNGHGCCTFSEAETKTICGEVPHSSQANLRFRDRFFDLHPSSDLA